DVAAAVGRAQLPKLRAWNKQRRANAEVLTAGLRGADQGGVIAPAIADGAEHVFHQYTIRVPGGAERRDRVREQLRERGVGTGVYYPTPIHLLKPYRPGEHPANRDWDLPETMRAAAEVLSLPVWPGLTDDQLARIVDAVNAVIGAH
ncbi:MAG TPA: DegT/DnrJ/EryC1/StrS family aminotransferase, partial [Nocardioidaceae bacterium]|nr:DegT/DnrJ/EryC1/StrS family aminotransferase [Nocardioidaceae bacterium]